MTTTETHPTADRARTPNRVSRVRLARELIRSEGLRSIWPRLLGRLVYRRVVVAAADMDAEYTVPECDIEMTIRKLAPQEIGAYAALVPNADPTTVARRLDAGSRIYAAWSDGRIITAGNCFPPEPWIFSMFPPTCLVACVPAYGWSRSRRLRGRVC